MNEGWASISADYAEDGYVVVRDLLSADEVDRFRVDSVLVLDGHRSLLELPPPGEILDGAELLEMVLCLHHVHKIGPSFRALAAHPRIVDLLRRIVGESVKCIQSQLFIKPAGFPGNAWHQDEGPIPTRDRSLVAVWIALDDSSAENGCLQVVPQSHKLGYLYPTRPHHRPDEFDFDDECYGFDEESARFVEVGLGSAVFFSGYLVHGSGKNRSRRYRRAVTYHYMNAYSPLSWRGVDDFRDVFMVAGADPYQWKGYVDRSVPHLRRFRVGGSSVTHLARPGTLGRE